MADLTSDSIGHAPIPRWVKVSGIIAIAVIVPLAIAMMIFGGDLGGHGPSRHAPPDASTVVVADDDSGP